MFYQYNLFGWFIIFCIVAFFIAFALAVYIKMTKKYTFDFEFPKNQHDLNEMVDYLASMPEWCVYNYFLSKSNKQSGLVIQISHIAKLWEKENIFIINTHPNYEEVYKYLENSNYQVELTFLKNNLTISSNNPLDYLQVKISD